MLGIEYKGYGDDSESELEFEEEEEFQKFRKRRGKRDWKELTRFWRMTDDELADLYKEDDEEEDEEEYKED